MDCSLPHRQLRKLAIFTASVVIRSLPHRQLRNTESMSASKSRLFTAAQAA